MVAGEEPLLKNGDFALDGERPVEWLVRGAEPGNPVGHAELDFEVHHTESPSLRLSNASPDEYTFVSQVVAVEPGTPYILQGWVKGRIEELGGDQAGGIRMAVADGTEGNIFAVSKRDDVSEEWKPIKVPFNSGENESIRVFLYLHHATGVAWFDDVEVVKED